MFDYRNIRENANAKKNDQKRKANDDSKTKNAKFAKIVNFAKIKILINAFSEWLHTISDARIEKDESFDNEKINSTTRDDDAENKKKDAIFEFLRTIFDTRLEKIDNFDEDDMIVKSNVNVEVVNLTEW